MKKILLYIMVIAGMASLQSCLHDDKVVFSESAAERLEHSTENAKKVLESATNGWAMQYYLGEGYTGAGITYLVKFENGKADVALDQTRDASRISHSSYDVVKDQGPVLTFNTFNELMHAFANPYQDGTTDGGDFEFTVMSVSNDTIVLKGRTTGNKMQMVRLPESTSWDDYISDILTFSSEMFPRYRLMVDGQEQGVVNFYDSDRRLVYNEGDGSEEYPYCVNPDGVQMPEALVADAHHFVQKEGEMNMTATDADGKTVTLEPILSPDYVTGHVGSSLSLGDGAQTDVVPLKLADKFTYTSDADWVTVSATEESVKIEVAANETGHPRVATVKVSNENGEGEITVIQVDFAKDVAGTYVLQYLDYQGEKHQSEVVVDANKPDAIDVPITVRGATLHATLTWNESTGSFDWGSFQYLGQWGSYYVYNIFVGDQYWSSDYTSYTYSAPVTYEEGVGTYAVFSQGIVNGEEISSVYIYACSNYPGSSSGFAGYIDNLSSLSLVKTGK